MTGNVRTWTPDMEYLGEAVVAIGVFDGVHIGHQALLRGVAAEARRRNVTSVAVTFDRDPDQIVTPDTAAPQLLSLEDKCRFILRCGVMMVLVVPFDAQIAATAPEPFLDEVLGAALVVRSIHVGHDFRFGAGAAGDLDTLYVWGVEHHADVRPHSLVEHDGGAVTSTRIRSLVASGDVKEATDLLGRYPRATGTVHEGRRQGTTIGFPTANIEPVPFAAIPADGVYAGYVLLDNGSVWPAAISVGTPPSFPEARDYLEAHLIGFEGDLYGRTVTLEFSERLRELLSFSTVDELSDAIAADVRAVVDALAPSALDPGHTPDHVFDPASTPGATLVRDDRPLSDHDLVDDPAALAAAERAVSQVEPGDSYSLVDDTWVELLGPTQLGGFWKSSGFSASLMTLPLDASGIPFVWDPYPPEHMPAFRPAYGAFDRGFALLVPGGRLQEAQRAISPVLDDFEQQWTADQDRPPSQDAATPEGRADTDPSPAPAGAAPFDFAAQYTQHRRKVAIWLFAFLFLAIDSGLLAFWLLGWFE